MRDGDRKSRDPWNRADTKRAVLAVFIGAGAAGAAAGGYWMYETAADKPHILVIRDGLEHHFFDAYPKEVDGKTCYYRNPITKLLNYRGRQLIPLTEGDPPQPMNTSLLDLFRN